MRSLVALTLLASAACSATRVPAGARAGSSNQTMKTDFTPLRIDEANLGALRLSKWRFPNGLEVVLAPDENARAVAYTTWFRVGSSDENEAQGETGLAHLFEHLMFTQTEGAEEGDFDRRMEAAGGSSNAMTDVDFTAYVNIIPSKALALAASLEADRMQHLALRPEQIETERQVVIEERLATTEDNVDGTLDELVLGASFREHPYRWPVIGHMEHIKKVPQAAVHAFYRRHYGPNNAVLVIAGKFDEAMALDTVAVHYGRLTSVEVPPRPEVKEQGPVVKARKTIPWPVPADRLALAVGAPSMGHPDRPAFEVMEALLSGGPGSRLNRALVVEGELASSAECQAHATRASNLLVFWVQLRPGKAAAQAEARIEALIEDLAATPVSPPELERAKNRLAMDFWSGLASSEGRAEQLGLFEVATGSYRNLMTRAEAYGGVTAADIQRVAHEYLRKRPRVVAVAVPAAHDDADEDPRHAPDASATP